jgi:hypothetical protein
MGGTPSGNMVIEAFYQVDALLTKKPVATNIVLT